MSLPIGTPVKVRAPHPSYENLLFAGEVTEELSYGFYEVTFYGYSPIDKPSYQFHESQLIRLTPLEALTASLR